MDSPGHQNKTPFPVWAGLLYVVLSLLWGGLWYAALSLAMERLGH
jgi:hypothetical protein